MKDKKILIVTHRQGFESDIIIDGLRQKGIEVFRFNTDAGQHVSNISYSISNKIRSLMLRCDDRVVDTSTITKAWFQQPYPFEIAALSEIDSLQRANLAASFNLIEEFSNFDWINKPSQTTRASNKIYQLSEAVKQGIRVPETLISNDQNEIKKFCSEKRVMKNLASSWYFKEGKLHAAFTKEVPVQILDRSDALQFCPIIYQEKVEKVLELRVISITDQVFCLAAAPDTDSIDIRANKNSGDNFYPFEFPESELTKLQSLKTKLGINYCSADYLLDKNGKYYFLEANTCGAWWWADRYFNNKISDVFVEELAKD